MYILAIGWLYVVGLAALTEAVNPNGSILASIMTFACYGMLPAGLLLYILGRPAKGGRPQPPPADLLPASDSAAPDAGCHASRAAEPGGVAPVRKED